MGGSPAKHVTVVQQPQLQIQPPILSQPGQQQYVPVSVVEPSGRQMLLTVSVLSSSLMGNYCMENYVFSERRTNLMAYQPTANGYSAILAAVTTSTCCYTTTFTVRSGMGQAFTGRFIGNSSGKFVIFTTT